MAHIVNGQCHNVGGYNWVYPVALKRYAAQRDGNEADIVEALRAAGYIVTHLSGVPGLPDLLVFKPGNKAPLYIVHTETQALRAAEKQPMALLEVKMPKEDLNPTQRSWWSKARAYITAES